MEEMKVCPFCGKEILAVAKMCKYCREWLPEEPINAAKPVGMKNYAETEETDSIEDCTQDNNRTGTDQASGLSSEERDAKIEELKKEKSRLDKYFLGQIGRDRAEKEGLDINEINRKRKEIHKELHKLDVEKGLEEGYWERTADGTIVSHKKLYSESYYRKQQRKKRILIIAIVVAIIFAVVWLMR